MNATPPLNSRKNIANEKQQSRNPYNIHRGDQWWVKAFLFFSFNEVMNSSKSKIHQNRSRMPLDDEGLALIYGKLKECCDDAESELREAIDYGLRLISGRRRHSDKQKAWDRKKEQRSPDLGEA